MTNRHNRVTLTITISFKFAHIGQETYIKAEKSGPGCFKAALLLPQFKNQRKFFSYEQNFRIC